MFETNSKDYHYLYKRALWLKIRKQCLEYNPTCALCSNVATICDHIVPHKGNESLFFNTGNLQSLCKNCHDSTKQRIEKHGYHNAIGVNGYPLDENHPSNLE